MTGAAQAALPLLYREAPITSVDTAARTVDMVWTTGATVRRIDWWTGRAYDEELVVSAAGVDLTRLNNSAPLLDSHNGYSLDGVIGVVERAEIKGNQGLATVRFAAAGTDPNIDRVFRLVEDKIVRNVSAGYRVRKVEKIERDGEVDLWRVVEWEPYELSLVPMGADPGAQTRADPRAPTFPVEFISLQQSKGERSMDTTETKPPVAVDPAAVAPPSQTETRSWSAGDIAKLQQRARAFGLDGNVALEVMTTARSLEEATDEMQRRVVASQKPAARPHIELIADEGDKLRDAVGNALVNRVDPQVKLTDGGRQFRGLTVMETARAYIEDSGGVRLRNLSRVDMAHVALGMTRAAGMQSTSDFPLLLANLASQRMRNTYAATIQTWKPIAKQNNASDLKERSIVTLSGMPEMLKVIEGAEYTYAKFGEAKEKYALAKYGRVVAFTEEMMINDSLGAFTNLADHFGRSAANLESDIVWGVFTGNPAMGDGKALFHADHGNLSAAGGAIAEATLDAAEQAMGAQTDAAGKAANIRAKFLAVPPTHQLAAKKMLTAITAAKTGDVNVYSNAMDLIVEQRLKPAAGVVPWYMIADPNNWDVIEYAYLDGEEGVKTTSRVGFEVDGLEVKGRIFFAAKAMDWRGVYKNIGV